MRAALSFSVAAISWGWSLVALASPLASPPSVTYSLGWTRMPGAETCIAAGPLARAVEARLGHAAFAPTSAADVQIEGYVEKRADRPGWQAHVVLVDRKGATLGQRDLASDEAACDALEEPLTLMLALIIDPQLLLAGAQREEPPAPAPAPPPASPPSAEPRRETIEEHPSAAPEPTKRGEVQVGVAFADGLLPDWAMGLSLDEALVAGGWTFEVGGTMWFPRDAAVDSTRGATFFLAEVTGRACPVTRRAPNALVRACGGIGAGVVVAHGFGFDNVRTRDQPAAFVSLSAEGALHLGGPAWLGVRMSAIAPLLRPTFVFADRNSAEIPVFQMSAIAGAVEPSFQVHF